MNYFDSAAFTECVHRHEVERPQTDRYEKTLVLRVSAPQLLYHQKLALCGNIEQLGMWQPEKALQMIYTGVNQWTAVIDATAIEGLTIDMKFIVKDDNPELPVLWEECDNRTYTIPVIEQGGVVDEILSDAWFSIRGDRLAGTAIPVFSLRSEGSFGVGDFGDLKMMIDWVAETEQSVLQVLPINDTTMTRTWTDCYPYSAISIFALHPQYVDLRQLPQIKDDKLRRKFEKQRKALNALPQIDYEAVNNAKTEYLRVIFAQEGAKMLATKGYKAWFDEEQQWLVPYAHYSILRDKYHTANYNDWPDHNVWDEADRKALTNKRTALYKEAAYYYFLQYVLAQQMKGAHDYAQTRKVVLKGDIPIGVNRDSCDAWMEPRYFNLNGQAGAPPDSFSVNGQNWGFPTYNWQEMLKDDCQWWVRRFSNMQKYFDAYRIDHVLGFFRIWEIPVHSVHGLLGQFQPALGLTREEVEAFGLEWQEESFLQPYITDAVIDHYFADKAQQVKEEYLDAMADGRYCMKAEYDTQRKVEAAFWQMKQAPDADEQALDALRDGLYSLISNVLFLRDHKDDQLLHPRICAQWDQCYQLLLDDAQKQAFNRLYDDYYYHRNNQFWYEEAMKKLPKLVDATRMLVCAEDLGMIPECVAWVMNELAILSLEIQSMPKEYGVPFGILSHNPFLSVCTISSHDTATLRMWWDEDRERTQNYWNWSMHREGEAPHPLSGTLAEEILRNHLACPSMLCILTLQDWLAIDESLRLADANAERINIPANPRHYWRYRMHLTLEQLLAAKQFNAKLKGMINELRP